MTELSVRPKVLTFLAAYLPAFRSGGPIRTLEEMVAQMSGELDFWIVAADRDAGDTEPFSNLPADQWTRCGAANVFYRSPGARGWRALRKSLKSIDYDVIYLNSLFSLDASLRPLAYRHLNMLLDRPVLLAPRGELDPGALAIKPLKKSVFLKAAGMAGLHRRVAWHASNAAERNSIMRHTGAPASAVFEAMDLSGRSSKEPAPRKRRSAELTLRLVFLSRISPKKNLQFALEILSRVSAPIQFDIYGVIEDSAYWRQCQAAMGDLPANVRARYLGEVLPQDVESTLAAYDLFLFPTLGENYGHVIREALSVGVPVLMSDTTPWRGLEAKGAGADLPLDDPDRFVNWIEQFARLPDPVRDAMAISAAEVGNDPSAAARNLQANRDMFASLLAASPRI